MATIVQPYNDWRERAATQILAPIITGLIERGVQNERNRKMNALMAKTIQDAQPSTGLLNAPEAPNGYNSDGWANALHQDYTPLTQYDFGTQGILPMTALRKTPSITEMWSALMSNMGTKRFGMVNPQEAMQTFSPYVQASVQERQEQQRNDLADALKGKDTAAQRELMTGGAVQGIVPFSALDQIQKQYEYDNPYPQPYTFNLGDRLVYGNINLPTGEHVKSGEYKINPTAAQVLDNSYRWGTLKENAREFNEGQNLRVRQQNFAEQNAEYERNNPKLDTIIDSDGTAYLINTRTGNVTEIRKPNGEVIKVNPKASDVILKEDGTGHYVAIDRTTGRAYTPTDDNGNPITAPQRGSSSNYRDMTTSQKAEYDDLKERAKQLNKDIKEYERQETLYSDEPKSREYLNSVANIERAKKELEEIRERQKELLGNTSTQPDNKAYANENVPKSFEETYAWYHPDKNTGYSWEQYEAMKTKADSGAYRDRGINSSADLDVYLKNVGMTPTKKKSSTAPKTASSDVAPKVTSADIRNSVLIPTLSADNSSPDVINHATSADIQAGVDRINGVTSSSDVSAQKPNIQTERLSLKDVPPDMFYNPERDNDIPQDNIVTPQQLAAIIQGIMNKHPDETAHLTPLTIAYQLYKYKGLRIKRG